MAREDDLFYFLQCATVASPRDDAWPTRVKEERYALQKFSEYLRYLEGNEWFTLDARDHNSTRWTGEVRAADQAFTLELVLKDAYPHTPPAVRIPELMHYTDRKLDDPVLGLRICDMHMEQDYWWDDHAGMALYLKREVSYWLRSVVHDMKAKGWI